MPSRKSSATFRVRDVAVAVLPEGYLAILVRALGHERVTISSAVPAGSVAAVARHLRGHASVNVAEALGLVPCTIRECSTARRWLFDAQAPARCERGVS